MTARNKLLLLSTILVILGTMYVVGASSQPTPEKTYSPFISPLLQTTPSITCTGISTPSQTEGPYYKTGSPERNNTTQGVTGEKLTVTGFVFNKNCEPIAHAWLDFWQANAHGQYDNVGYTLRGHQFTDNQGQYRLETIVPAKYETRPPHIHVKVRDGNSPILTSQLYFPDPPAGGQNQTDSIFNPALVMHVVDDSPGKVGTFNFVLP